MVLMIMQLRFNLTMKLRTLITIVKIQMERYINQVGMDKNTLSNNSEEKLTHLTQLYQYGIFT